MVVIELSLVDGIFDYLYLLYYLYSITNKMLGLMKRIFKSRDANTWKKLYASYIRPHLEFAAPVWNPYAKGDIEKLEKIQHRATKVSHTLKNLDYQSRCKELNLRPLEKRRTRGDLIQKFKIENKIDEINWEFEPTVLPPRGDLSEIID